MTVTVDDVLLIELPRFTDESGQLVVIEQGKGMPFAAVRMFTVRAEAGALRGQHAHKRCAQLLCCVHGVIEVECSDGVRTREFVLDAGDKALLVPAGIWANERYVAGNSVLAVLCDRPYEVDDYLRDYDAFVAFRRDDG